MSLVRVWRRAVRPATRTLATKASERKEKIVVPEPIHPPKPPEVWESMSWYQRTQPPMMWILNYPCHPLLLPKRVRCVRLCAMMARIPMSCWKKALSAV